MLYISFLAYVITIYVTLLRDLLGRTTDMAISSINESGIHCMWTYAQ
jgi:hypothetical protein